VPPTFKFVPAPLYLLIHCRSVSTTPVPSLQRFIFTVTSATEETAPVQQVGIREAGRLCWQTERAHGRIWVTGSVAAVRVSACYQLTAIDRHMSRAQSTVSCVRRSLALSVDTRTMATPDACSLRSGVPEKMSKTTTIWGPTPDRWLTCDHFVGEVSAMGQPTRLTQPSVPPESVNE